MNSRWTEPPQKAHRMPQDRLKKRKRGNIYMTFLKHRIKRLEDGLKDRGNGRYAEVSLSHEELGRRLEALFTDCWEKGWFDEHGIRPDINDALEAVFSSEEKLEAFIQRWEKAYGGL